jgi:hypothetical protein
MRKGINGLALMAGSLLWDEQGFCLLYKCLDKGKFTWLNKRVWRICRHHQSAIIDVNGRDRLA